MPSWGPDLVNKLISISISIFILGEINQTHDSRIFSTEKKEKKKMRCTKLDKCLFAQREITFICIIVLS
jgi:hypothetical protein